MPNTIDCRFGDVVLVPFPFTNQTTSKKRPAVIVSSDTYHRERQDVVVVAVTSRTASPSAKTGDVQIDQWHESGLLKASLIKPVFMTLEKGMILRTLGALQPRDDKALRAALQQVLG